MNLTDPIYSNEIAAREHLCFYLIGQRSSFHNLQPSSQHALSHGQRHVWTVALLTHPIPVHSSTQLPFHCFLIRVDDIPVPLIPHVEHDPDR